MRRVLVPVRHLEGFFYSIQKGGEKIIEAGKISFED